MAPTSDLSIGEVEVGGLVQGILSYLESLGHPVPYETLSQTTKLNKIK